MISVETLPHSKETYDGMKQVCSDWERVAKEKMAEHAGINEGLFKRYVASKSVCENSFYRFRKQQKSLQEHEIDVAYDDHLNLKGFAFSKIVSVKETPEAEPGRYLFLRYVTANPNEFEGSHRTKDIGKTILAQLKRRCVSENLDGILSEPVLSAMPALRAHGFADTELRLSKRKALLLRRADFDTC